MTESEKNDIDLSDLGEKILDGLKEQMSESNLAFRDMPKLLATASRCSIYQLSITGFRSSPELNDRPLVCKVHREGNPKSKKEAKVTQAVHQLGFPAPQILSFCEQQGFPDFCVMTYMEGRNLLFYSLMVHIACLLVGFLWSWPLALVVFVVFSLFLAGFYVSSWQELHGLPSGDFVSELGDSLSYDEKYDETYGETFLSSLAERARLAGCDLNAELNYLRSNLPNEPGVICHGDFHFWNVKTNPFVIGVIDWEESLIAPRELDLAWFRVVREWTDIPHRDQKVDWLIARVFYWVFAAQLKLIELVYQVRCRLNEDLMRYFTVLHLTKGLIAIAEVEAAGGTWTMRTMKQRVHHRLDKLLK